MLVIYIYIYELYAGLICRLKNLQIDYPAPAYIMIERIVHWKT